MDDRPHHQRATPSPVPRRRPGVGVVGLPLALALRPSAVLAHDGAPLAPHDFWGAWHWDPLVLLALALAAWAYARGLRVLWRRAGAGGGIDRWRGVSFAGGIGALAVALVTPLDALGSALFAAHMTQHLVLILVAAPLLILGRPLVPFLWALPRASRRVLGGWSRRSAPVRAGWRVLTGSVVAWVLHAVVVWLWHLPGLYEATLRTPGIHALAHGSFLGTALLFWWTLIHPRRYGRLAYGASLLSVFTMAVQSGVLGALITFARTPWYPLQAANTAAWNLTPLEDQQLAGLIMWVPAGLVYGFAATVLFVAWLRAVEREVGRQERRAAARAPGGARWTGEWSHAAPPVERASTDSDTIILRPTVVAPVLDAPRRGEIERYGSER